MNSQANRAIPYLNQHTRSMKQMSRKEAVLELKELYKILEEDVTQAQALCRVRDTPFARRTLVRTYFSFIEGLAYNMRQVTLASLVDTGVLSDGELSLLREEKYSLNDKGLVKTPQESYLNTGPGFLFSMRTYAKCHGAEFEPQLGDGGWEAFKKSAEIRNRITHPKSAERLVASDKDMEDFTTGAKWAVNVLKQMFSACELADDSYRNPAAQ